jgi:N6-adenosine-specific RNA methylase IME4
MAKRIRARGNEALIDAVSNGKCSVHVAETLIGMGDKDLARLLARDKRSIIEQAKGIREQNKAVSRAQKTERLNALSRASHGLVKTLPRNAFPVLYADVPWENEVWGDETGNDRSPPYPPMTIEEIKVLCAGERSPALETAILFFWSNTNRLANAIDIIRCWGFEYSTAYVWDKVVAGMGRRVRDRHEHLLIATRGGIHAPPPETLAPSVVAIRKGGHSEKPARFAEIIDAQYPDLNKLEMFQRAKSLRPDDIRLHQREKGRWSFWGNEATQEEGS